MLDLRVNIPICRAGVDPDIHSCPKAFHLWLVWLASLTGSVEHSSVSLLYACPMSISVTESCVTIDYMHRSIPEIIKVKRELCLPQPSYTECTIVHIGLLFLLCKALAAIAQSAVSLIMGRRGRNEDETSCETSQTGCRGSSLPCSLLQLCIHYSATIQLTMRSLLTNIHYSASD